MLKIILYFHLFTISISFDFDTFIIHYFNSKYLSVRLSKDYKKIDINKIYIKTNQIKSHLTYFN